MSESETVVERPASRLRRIAAKAAPAVLIALLPPLLAILGYYRPALRGEPLPVLHADAAFYAYQLERAVELNGRWWKIADDPLVGAPYQNEVEKHPGLYEGVDLILLTALFGRWMASGTHYHLAVVGALAFNGWVAGWLVRRLTGSWWWAAAAIVLITWNFPTQGRIMGHLHLFKYGWCLLAVAAFHAYLERPSARRGAVLGLAMGAFFGASYYLAFLGGVALAAWWVGMLAAGRLSRAHVGVAVIAGAAFVVTAAVLAFPVFTVAKRAILADTYFQRSWNELSVYGAELWQYFVPPSSSRALEYTQKVGSKPAPTFGEGWNYPGLVVLLGVAAYYAARMRGFRIRSADPVLIDRMAGLIAVLVVLSLSGGPNFFLISVASSFRCYGRAGLLAMALGCVVAPVVLKAVIDVLPRRSWKAAAALGVLAFAGYEGFATTRYFNWWPADEATPAWVGWLKKQPAGTRLAALRLPPSPGAHPFNWWGMNALRYRFEHRRPTLNGAEFRLLEGDLRLLGCTYEKLNPAGLRFLASLGYERLALHDDYLAANAWLRDSAWLETLERRDGWTIVRATAALPRMPRTTLARTIEDRGARPTQPVPPRAWITEGWDAKTDTVVTDRGSRTLTWFDSKGRKVGTPVPAMYQHVVGSGMPAFVVRTPSRGGTFRLALRDDRGATLWSKNYAVTPGLRTTERAFRGFVPQVGLAGDAASVRAGMPDGLTFRVTNDSPYYMQAHVDRTSDFLPPTVQAHPGILAVWPGIWHGSLDVWLHANVGEGPAQDVDLILPRDLPPGDSFTFTVAADRLRGVGERTWLEAKPVFIARGDAPDTTGAAVRLTIEPAARAAKDATRR